MFAVPGWSVSAANLKSEAGQNQKGADKSTDKAASKKRKRASGPPKTVDSKNVADLWETVIEGKSAKKAKHQEKKDQEGADPKSGDAASSRKGRRDSSKGVASSEPAPANDDVREKKEKQKKSKAPKKTDDGHEEASPAETKQPSSSKKTKPAATLPAAAPVPAAAPKLTPLQASMREKLVSARFRHLNETLYTRPSAEAFGLFAESPEMFQEYHEGFRRQVNVWPENPVDGYIEDIKLRGRQNQQRSSRDHKGRGKTAAPVEAPSSGLAPLLRTKGVCTIADLGCGDAKLATVLQAEKKKLNLEVLSFDLQSPSPLVTRADIANLPLEDGSVNTVIFCLALMGTNWLDFIEEAYRILHWKGELWIAEIKSRFVAPSAAGGKGAKGKNVVLHSVGNRRKNNKAGKGKGKGNDEEQEAANQAELAVEIDGVEAQRQETDVSAFVEALRKRGFVLQQQRGEHAKPAVDLSNKMFVKMHFIKGAPAVVGKNAEASAAGGAQGRGDGFGQRRKNGLDIGKKFLDKEDTGALDEGSILKPCVYKIR
jgi:ribosomal RNA-processing protein 8